MSSESKFTLNLNKRLSKLIEDKIYVDNKPIDFVHYEPMKFVYEIDVPEMLILAGRQIGKSNYLATRPTAKSVLYPGLRMLYVAPLESQAKTWSKTKLKPIIEGSPYISYFFRRQSNNVFFKENILGSYIEITYASMESAEPARVRGKSADDLSVDEVQDILPDALPVIKETTTSSLNPRIVYAGTAKSAENLTAVLWNKFTKIERVYKCEHCKKYNTITRANIGKEGLICSKCGKPLQHKNSQFVVIEKKDPTKVAVRLPQVIMPFHQLPQKWKDVWSKYEEYPPEKFNQEVLAIPSGVGARLITIEKLQKLCRPGKHLARMYMDEFQYLYGSEIIIGIDWSGEGTQDDKSRTVAVAMGRNKKTGDFEMIGGIILPPGDPEQAVNTVSAFIRAFRGKYICADAGMGAIQNSMLMKAFGSNAFVQVRYSGSMGKQPYRWHGAARLLTVQKTEVIDTFMLMLLDKYKSKLLKPAGDNKVRLLFPNFNESRPFFKDILAEFEQVSKSGQRIWTHSPDQPDDALHAFVYGIFGYMFLTKGKIQLY